MSGCSLGLLEGLSFGRTGHSLQLLATRDQPRGDRQQLTGERLKPFSLQDQRRLLDSAGQLPQVYPRQHHPVAQSNLPTPKDTLHYLENRDTL
jgi:hypothetical protein